MSGEAYQLSPDLRGRLTDLVERQHAASFCAAVDACIRRWKSRAKRFGFVTSAARVASLRALETALAAVQQLTTDPVVQSTFRPILLEKTDISRDVGVVMMEEMWMTPEVIAKAWAAAKAQLDTKGSPVPPGVVPPDIPRPEIQELDATISAALMNVQTLIALWERSIRVGSQPKVLRSQLLADLVHTCRSFDINEKDRDDVISWVCTELEVALPQNATHRRMLVSAAEQEAAVLISPPL